MTLTEEPMQEAAELPQLASEDPFVGGRQLWLVLGGLMSGMFLAALDQTVVGTAMPTIAGDLHRADLLTWVITAYLLSSTATAPLYGKLGDLYGRKRVFQTAIVIFVGASVLCALAQTMFELIICRGLQGVGAGGLMTLTLAIVGDLVPLRERGRYQGLFAVVFLAASVLGPLIGGLAVDQFTWQFIFWLNIPLGILVLIVTQRLLKLPRVRHEHKLDILGATLIMSGIAALLIAAQSGGREWGWGSPQLLGTVTLGVVLLIGFGLWELQVSEPLLPLTLFRSRTFTVANSMALVSGAAMMGAVVFIPQYLQIARGIKATESGLRTLPFLFGMMVTSTISGRLISKYDRYKPFPIVGSALLCVGLVMLSGVSANSSLTGFAISMAVFGSGLGMLMQTLVLAAQNAVSREHLGVATSTVTFFRSMGGSIGASALGAVLNAHFHSNIEARTHTVMRTSGKGSVLSSPEQVLRLPPPIRHLVVTSFSDALHSTYLWAVPVAVVVFAMSWWLPQQTLGGGLGDRADLSAEESAEVAVAAVSH